MPKRYVPNVLTISRGGVGVAIFILYYLGYGMWLERLVILLLYAGAGVSDAIDGWLARKWNCVSAFGGTADPIADKVLFWLTCWILWREGYVYLPLDIRGIEITLYMVVAVYDVVTTTLRILASFGVVRMYTTSLAKWKTIFLLSGLGLFLAIELGAVWWSSLLPSLLPSFVLVYGTFGIALTIASAIAYAYVCATAQPAARSD